MYHIYFGLKSAERSNKPMIYLWHKFRQSFLRTACDSCEACRMMTMVERAVFFLLLIVVASYHDVSYCIPTIIIVVVIAMAMPAITTMEIFQKWWSLKMLVHEHPQKLYGTTFANSPFPATTSGPPNARQLKPADRENHSSPKQAAPNPLRKFLRLEMHQAKLPANQGWKY